MAVLTSTASIGEIRTPAADGPSYIYRGGGRWDLYVNSGGGDLSAYRTAAAQDALLASEIASLVDSAGADLNTFAEAEQRIEAIETSLSSYLKNDGTAPPVADIPLGGFRLTGVGDAQAATDALNQQSADARYAQNAGVLQVNGTAPGADGDIAVTPATIGAAPATHAHTDLSRVAVLNGTFGSTAPLLPLPAGFTEAQCSFFWITTSRVSTSASTYEFHGTSRTPGFVGGYTYTRNGAYTVIGVQ